MSKTLRAIGTLTLAGAVSASALAGYSVAQDHDRDAVPLTLNGCVLPAQTPFRYFVTDVVATGHPSVPSAAFYRFDPLDNGKLREYVGKRVEITGKADLADPDDAKIRVQLEDGNLTTAVTSERRRIAMDSPVWAGTMGEIELEADVQSYGFDIESVRPVEGACAK